MTPIRIILMLLVITLLFSTIVSVLITTTYKKSSPSVTPIPDFSFDFNNLAFRFNDHAIAFDNGVYMSPDGKETVKVLQYTINSQRNRAAAIIVDNPGGSGTFYYLLSASKRDGHELYGKPLLLGDRVKVTKLTVSNPEKQDNGIITVEYLDHAQNEPLAAEPTVPVIKKYVFEEDGYFLNEIH